MSKKFRQYIGLAVAVLLYYIIHEGAHLAVALAQGAFKQINLIGMGVQIDVYAEQMSDTQMGLFCLAGPVATLIAGWLLVVFVGPICRIGSDVVRTCAWYTSLTMLMLDAVYLSVFYSWVGGGDMNGIALLIPEIVARIGYGVLLAVNIVVFFKVVLPKYRAGFDK